LEYLPKSPPTRNSIRLLVLSELDALALDSLAKLWIFDRHPDVADRLAGRVRRLLERAAA
jgi:hypothetical protein